MWTLIIIFVVVVVVDDDAYYWVYLSSDHLFQAYYKVRQLFLLQRPMVCYYKVRQVLQSVTILLQSATGITKCDDYYKVRQYMVTDRIGRHEVLLPINHNFNKICDI